MIGLNPASNEASVVPQSKMIVGDVLAKLREIETGSVNLIISSPPYNIKKSYERETKLSLSEYLVWQTKVVKELNRTLVDGGSVCWQTGTYVDQGVVLPLDIPFFKIFDDLELTLRNRIVWRFGFGQNADKRFSGRYETILWFTKGGGYKFNLDAVRVPQLYPGKRHAKTKGERAGKLSGNSMGKNPSDFWEFKAERAFFDNPIWDIPNVKNNHPEKTSHPCQFPVELAERCVLAFTNEGDTVLDPFIGTGSTAIASEKNNRNCIGIDKEEAFIKLAESRLAMLRRGDLPLRASGKPVLRPDATSALVRFPLEWHKQP